MLHSSNSKNEKLRRAISEKFHEFDLNYRLPLPLKASVMHSRFNLDKYSDEESLLLRTAHHGNGSLIRAKKI